jgi:hypothetical protein
VRSFRHTNYKIANHDDKSASSHNNQTNSILLDLSQRLYTLVQCWSLIGTRRRSMRMRKIIIYDYYDKITSNHHDDKSTHTYQLRH